MRALATLTVVALFWALPASARDAKLAQFLQAKFDLAEYRAAPVDLNGDGLAEVVVLAQARSFCGSGGCMMLVLTAEGESYRVVTKTTVVQKPIRLLPTSTNGWRDIVVRVGGGGAEPANRLLGFDGRTYPTNPTVPPSRPIAKVGGRVLID